MVMDVPLRTILSFQGKHNPQWGIPAGKPGILGVWSWPAADLCECPPPPYQLSSVS